MKTKLVVLLIAVYSITHAQYMKLIDFAGISNGSLPVNSLIFDGTYLYGTALGGGTNQSGSIFKIKPDGTGYSEISSLFGGPYGSFQICSLIYDGVFLYGMNEYAGSTGTVAPGSSGYGTIYKIKPDGTGYSKLFDFDGATTGGNPYGSLISDGIFYYGLTTLGGTNNLGVIFKIKSDGTGYTKLLDFAGVLNGGKPTGTLFYDGTFLYGLTRLGGVNNLGTIFKIKSDGTGYTKLLDFDGSSNGSQPCGSLISDGTFLYGMTNQGGLNNVGVVFKIKTDGTGYTKLLDFNGSQNGAAPHGAFISDGTFLYGTTSAGGANNLGLVFKIKRDGTAYTKMLDFAGTTNGSQPLGSLFSDGTFLYGTTSQGGANNMGTVFKLGINTFVDGITENKIESEITIFPNPFSQQTCVNTKINFKNATLTIYNSNGLVVRQLKNNFDQTVILSRGNLPNGVYFIQIKQDDAVIFKKKLVIND